MRMPGFRERRGWSPIYQGHKRKALYQDHRHGAPHQRHLWNWLSPTVTVAKSPYQPASWSQILIPKYSSWNASKSSLTNHLMPPFQQKFSLSCVVLWNTWEVWLSFELARSFNSVSHSNSPFRSRFCPVRRSACFACSTHSIFALCC